MAMILDADLFARLEARGAALGPGDAEVLAPIVARSIELKADIVERDERESGDRMLLNYGHTVGHALEAGAGYGTLLHGEAVAVGMQAAASIAQRMGMLDADAAAARPRCSRRCICRCAGRPRLTTSCGVSLDKKRAGERQRWVLAERVGAGRIRDDVPADIVREAVSSITSR